MLELREVNKKFRGVQALDNVSLSISEGSCVAFVGDNGAGKSTLAKCVSGALNPDSGSISFRDISLSRATPESARAAGIEMVYQDLNLCRMQSAVSNIFLGREKTRGLFLDHFGMENECHNALLELGVNLPLHAPVGKLSGGQQQLVAIARALLSRPQVLILDEPTAALAIKETARVLAMVTGLKKIKITTLMISHRLPDIFAVADRIIVMRQGRVTADLLPQSTSMKELTEKIIGE